MSDDEAKPNETVHSLEPTPKMDDDQSPPRPTAQLPPSTPKKQASSPKQVDHAPRTQNTGSPSPPPPVAGQARRFGDTSIQGTPRDTATWIERRLAAKSNITQRSQVNVPQGTYPPTTGNNFDDQVLTTTSESLQGVDPTAVTTALRTMAPAHDGEQNVPLNEAIPEQPRPAVSIRRVDRTPIPLMGKFEWPREQTKHGQQASMLRADDFPELPPPQPSISRPNPFNSHTGRASLKGKEKVAADIVAKIVTRLEQSKHISPDVAPHLTAEALALLPADTTVEGLFNCDKLNDSPYAQYQRVTGPDAYSDNPRAATAISLHNSLFSPTTEPAHDFHERAGGSDGDAMELDSPTDGVRSPGAAKAPWNLSAPQPWHNVPVEGSSTHQYGPPAPQTADRGLTNAGAGPAIGRARVQTYHEVIDVDSFTPAAAYVKQEPVEPRIPPTRPPTPANAPLRPNPMAHTPAPALQLHQPVLHALMPQAPPAPQQQAPPALALPVSIENPVPANDADRAYAAALSQLLAATKTRIRAIRRSAPATDGMLANEHWANVNPRTKAVWDERRRADPNLGGLGMRVFSIDGDTNVGSANQLSLLMELQDQLSLAIPGSNHHLTQFLAALDGPPASPGTFYVSRITKPVEEMLLLFEFLLFGRLAVTTFPFEHGNSEFMGTFTGSMMNETQHIEKLQDACMASDEILEAFIQSLTIPARIENRFPGTGIDGRQLFVDSITAVVMEITPPGASKRPVKEYNVYAKTSGIIHDDDGRDIELPADLYTAVRNAFATLVIEDDDLGRAAMRAPYNCVTCLRTSHPTGKCPGKTLELARARTANTNAQTPQFQPVQGPPRGGFGPERTGVREMRQDYTSSQSRRASVPSAAHCSNDGREGSASRQAATNVDSELKDSGDHAESPARETVRPTESGYRGPTRPDGSSKPDILARRGGGPARRESGPAISSTPRRQSDDRAMREYPATKENSEGPRETVTSNIPRQDNGSSSPQPTPTGSENGSGSDTESSAYSYISEPESEDGHSDDESEDEHREDWSKQRGVKKTKASLLLASENIRGRGAQSVRGSMKWRKLAEDIRSQKIGVMALQETHLSPEHVNEVMELHKHLHIVNSAHPDNPTGAGGVALVFNKNMMNYEEVESKVLVPGRAIMAKFSWHRGQKLTVMAVYASTERTENHNMWEEIRTKLKARSWKLGKPDVVLGDFNFVEDEVDRFPAALTRMDKPPSFDNLKRDLKIKDGWRAINPTRTEWTWRDAARKHMSRIDRVYLTEKLLASSREWEIQISGVTRDDHSRIQLKIYALDSPDIGKGRWAMRANLTRDTTFLETVNDLTRKAKDEVDAVKKMAPRPPRNAQIIWQELKSAIKVAARKRTTEINCKRATRERHLQVQRRLAATALKEAEGPERAKAERALRLAEKKLHDQKDADYRRTFELRSARTWAEAETMSKSWFSWVKDRRKAEDIPFFAEKQGETVIPITDPHKMAEHARQYHDNVQARDLDVDAEERERATLEALKNVTVRLTSPEREAMAAAVTREDVAESVRLAKHDKAAGLDGLIHELWKALNSKHRSLRGRRKHQIY
ncbi:hypothetical protein AURDEDRAFT_130204 [Auricularia subglabra TFB-10046 SS5]|nr:hypothetical protein AURDEDRAFT_130204 [Auricularia subglabra TFB-10046 SS5]